MIPIINPLKEDIEKSLVPLFMHYSILTHFYAVLQNIVYTPGTDFSALTDE